MAEIYQLPENGGGSNQVPAWLPYVSNGGGFLGGGNGWGGGILGFLLGLMFGNGGWGGGLLGGGNGNTAMLANTQDLLMQAVNNNGDRGVQATQQLATTLGQDFNLVNGGIQAIQTALSGIAAQQGISRLQVINSIQAGDSALAAQLSQACCQQQLSVCQQTNTLQNGANANTQAILAKLGEMQTQTLQDKLDAARAENTRLAGEMSQAQQNNAIAAMIANAVSPLAGQLAGIRSEVDAIKRCQPQTVTLPDNSRTVVPTIWANAVADNLVDRISAAITAATTTTTTTPTTGA